jgi:hypothetical protein
MGRKGREDRKEGNPSPCLRVKKPTKNEIEGLYDNFTILPRDVHGLGKNLGFG